MSGQMLGLWGQTHLGSRPKPPLLISVTWCLRLNALETESEALEKEIHWECAQEKGTEAGWGERGARSERLWLVAGYPGSAGSLPCRAGSTFQQGAGVSYRVSQPLPAMEGKVQHDLPGPGISPWLREVLQEREGAGGSPPSLELGWCSSPEEGVP